MASIGHVTMYLSVYPSTWVDYLSLLVCAPTGTLELGVRVPALSGLGDPNEPCRAIQRRGVLTTGKSMPHLTTIPHMLPMALANSSPNNFVFARCGIQLMPGLEFSRRPILVCIATQSCSVQCCGDRRLFCCSRPQSSYIWQGCTLSLPTTYRHTDLSSVASIL